VSHLEERRAADITEAFGPLSVPDRLAFATRRVAGRVVFTTSFGLEDQAIADAIFRRALPIDVVTLDTGRLFPETYDVWAQTEARYGAKIAGRAPASAALETLIGADGINGFRQSVSARERCCGVRKVEPLKRALLGAAGWITGLRAEQSPDRAAIPFASFDASRGLIKINPLADWTRERLVAHVKANHIPYNSLHDRGFASIGCAPCTRAIAPGEPERAGRWWWESGAKKECGLHNRPLREPGLRPVAPAPAKAHAQ
jgi:phosphoadenosine phosphosulfate reductase